jgi:2-polyprenyl-6-methoxyphenol hydroxylase-like FAD-dependent oxidoreductase
LNNSGDTHDAIVIGASLAGCTTAILLARAGASVLLVDQRPGIDAYKVVCGHYIQASAISTIERLGLLEPMLAAGAVRSPIRIWFDGTVIGPLDTDVIEPSINLPRRKLDPMLRGIASRTEGVELRMGTSLVAIEELEHNRVSVTLSAPDGESTRANGRLIVGADGRDSKVAELASVRAVRSKNGRFNYSPFYAGPPPEAAPAATSWFMGDQWAGAFPTSDGLTGYYLMPTHDRLPEYKQDLKGACLRFISELPGAPPVEALSLAGPIVGRIDLANQWRNPIGSGMALVGDAALSIDPLYGVGCGWAMQTGELLADAVAPMLKSGNSLEKGLRGYRRAVASKLIPHTLQMSGYSRGRAPNPFDRFAMRRAARNDDVAEYLIGYVARKVSPFELMSPAGIATLLRA